eukprot:sb/3469122/
MSEGGGLVECATCSLRRPRESEREGKSERGKEREREERKRNLERESERSNQTPPLNILMACPNPPLTFVMEVGAAPETQSNQATNNIVMACPRRASRGRRDSTKSVSEWSLAIRPDKVSECTWKLGGTEEKSPHNHKIWTPPTKFGVLNSVLENIGNSPMVRLERLKKLCNLKCDIFAKCEFFNSGGSVKDRIGLRMVEEAEKAGTIKPGEVWEYLGCRPLLSYFWKVEMDLLTQQAV